MFDGGHADLGEIRTLLENVWKYMERITTAVRKKKPWDFRRKAFFYLLAAGTFPRLY